MRFLRQYAIGHCILDFYAPSIRLAVELDGGQHHEANGLAQDEVRSQWLAARGIEVLRYTNLDVSRRMDDVLDGIVRAVMRLQRAHPPRLWRDPLPAEGGDFPLPSERRGIEGDGLGFSDKP